MEWNDGYVADVGYTYGYYHELNPLRMKLAFLNAGLAVPSIGAACELGFGQGMSTNMHAAATVTKWYGTDFNPAQAGFAQELASVSDSGAQLFDQSFAEFCSRSDLPDFDYICLHGIWTWISDENRNIIVDFVRRKLKVGGVLYVSYNTMPGWSNFAPMRHLMSRHAEVIGSDGIGTVNRAKNALDFIDAMMETKPEYANANPHVAERVKTLRQQNPYYIAHEYFNRDWKPMHFADIADWLAPAKVSFACSAHHLEHVDMINLSPEQRTFLAQVPDASFRQSVRDFMVNQQFRRDYWVKGARKLTPIQQAETLQTLRVVLITPVTEIPLTVTGTKLKANLSEAIYRPILNALADYKARSIGELVKVANEHKIAFAQLVEVLMVLTGSGHLSVAQDEASIAQAKAHTEKLNLHLMRLARDSGDVNALASPVTGGGIIMGRFTQLFLLGVAMGKSKPEELMQFVWALLVAQGQKLTKEGKVIESNEDNLAELLTQARGFIQLQLPMYRALQII